MQNPILLVKLLQHKQLFENEHPKFIKFVNYMMQNPPPKGSVITIEVKRPDNSCTTASINITDNDVEIMNKLQEI